MKRILLLLFVSILFTNVKGQLFISPNPYVTQVTLSYTVSVTDTITFKMYNLNGQLIQTFINDSLVNAGTYTINYSPNISLPNGIYVFHLTVGDSSYTKKGVYEGGTYYEINKIPNSSTNIIYPNPTNGNFIIETNNTEKQILEIVDVTGKIVFSRTVNGKVNIDASGLDNGIYFTHVKANENSSTQKIIINH